MLMGTDDGVHVSTLSSRKYDVIEDGLPRQFTRSELRTTAGPVYAARFLSSRRVVYAEQNYCTLADPERIDHSLMVDFSGSADN